MTRPSSRHAALVLAVALTACSGSEPELLPPLEADENILVVSFDALRADALGVYGYPREVSPNIDRWASEALVFDRFYTAGQATPTSFAAAFTGQYPFRIFREWQLAETQTLAKVMKKAGFTTIGLFHNIQVSTERNFHQGFDEYETKTPQESDQAVVDRAGELLAKHRDDRFFAWVHFISPHTPYQYLEAAEHLYTPGYEGEYERTSGPLPDPGDDPGELRRLRELYDGEVLLADSLFQQMLDLLEELGLGERTLVILTSDHGEQFMEHGGMLHSEVYEEVVRIPFVLDHPRAPSGGGRSDRLSLNTDLLPSLADLVGAPYVPTADGHSFVGEESTQRRFAVFTAMTNRKHRSMAVRAQDMKLIVTCPTQKLTKILVDLAADPGEQTNLIGEQPDVAEKMSGAMESIIGGKPCDVIADAVKGVPIEQGFDEEAIESLRALGYIQ